MESVREGREGGMEEERERRGEIFTDIQTTYTLW